MSYPERGESIERHESLQPLSRHHMVALLLALNLRRVGTEKSKSTPEEMQLELKAFWLPEGQEHFREEEEILVTTFAQHAEVDIPEVQDMLMEHVKIRALIDTILKMEEIDISAMHKLGELLDLHVRKEERILFPLIEKALPEEVLNEMAPYLE